MNLAKILAPLAFVSLLLVMDEAAGSVLFYDGFAAGGTSATAGSGQYVSDPASTNGRDNDSLLRSAGDGQNPAVLGFIGATGGWNSSDGVSSAVYPRVNDMGLLYAGLETQQGAVDIFRGTSNGSSQIKTYSRAFASDVGLGATDLYFRVLMQFDASVPGSLRLDQGAAYLGFGFDNAGKLSLYQDGGTLGTSTTATAAGTINLLVAHVYDSNKVDLWLNPTDFTSEAANSAQKVFTGLTLTSFTPGAALTTLRITSNTGNGIANPDFIFDEVRGATSWQETFNVPEPSTGLFLAGGLVVWGCRRRTMRI